MRGRNAKIAAAAAGLVLAAGGVATAASVTVALGPTGPQPAVLTADWGDTLAFVNNDTVAHGLTVSREGLAGGQVPPGGTITGVVTARAGSYQFHQTGTKSYAGTVEVTAGGTVTLKVRSTDLLYGQRVAFSGVATKPGTPVVLEERLLGDATWQDAATVTSDSAGAFAATIPLARGAKLRATIDAGQVRSGQIDIAVAPRLTLAPSTHRAKAGHVVGLRARLEPVASARRVTLLACTPQVGRWQPIATARTTAAGTASFRWKAAAGKTLLRASVGRKDAAQGFAPRESARIAVTGVGPLPAAKHHRPRRAC
jgi:plastocyanin